MQIGKLYIGLFFLCSLSSCSQVDSLRPFDQTQAAQILQASAGKKPAQQMIALTLPQQQHWRRIPESSFDAGYTLMLVPRQQTATHWQENIRTRINGYAFHPEMTANKMMADEIVRAKKQCRHVETSTLTQTPQHVIYQLDLADCQNEHDQRQIGKAFNGVDAVYLVRYAAVKGEVSAATYLSLSQTIKTARLVRSVQQD